MNPSLRRPENFRVATVTDAQMVTPLMRRITVGVDDLSRFDCPPRALGPHVHALIPRADMAEQEWPTADARGHAVYPPPERRPALRTYSVRRFHHDTNRIELDFVIHGDEGIASSWAARAVPGDRIGLWRPHARLPETEPERYLLAGDMTALPAIAFILDHLSEDATGDVLISVPGPQERQDLRLPRAMHLTWLYEAPGRGEALMAAVQALGTDGLSRGLVWAGAEASISRRIRDHARRACGLPAAQVYVLNYWKRGMVEGSYDHGE